MDLSNLIALIIAIVATIVLSIRPFSGITVLLPIKNVMGLWAGIACQVGYVLLGPLHNLSLRLSSSYIKKSKVKTSFNVLITVQTAHIKVQQVLESP